MKVLRLFVMVILVAGENKNQKSGPYRSILLAVNECQNKTNSLEKDLPVQVYMKARAISSVDPRDRVLTGNITVVRETKGVRMKIKSFVWDGAKWRLAILMDHVSCNGRLLYLICQALGFTMFNATKCAFLKGTFTFTAIDIDKIQHILKSTMEYGRRLWRSELTVGETYHCWEFHTVVQPV